MIFNLKLIWYLYIAGMTILTIDIIMNPNVRKSVSFWGLIAGIIGWPAIVIDYVKNKIIPIERRIKRRVTVFYKRNEMYIKNIIFALYGLFIIGLIVRTAYTSSFWLTILLLAMIFIPFWIMGKDSYLEPIVQNNGESNKKTIVEATLKDIPKTKIFRKKPKVIDIEKHITRED